MVKSNEETSKRKNVDIKTFLTLKLETWFEKLVGNWTAFAVSGK